ncbi:hypothetical protein E2C01_063364 [Portunus trituberculatus]
MREDT